MRWLREVLDEDVVIEIWKDRGEYRVLATRGSEPGRRGHAFGHRNPRRAVEGAVRLLREEEKP